MSLSPQILLRRLGFYVSLSNTGAYFANICFRMVTALGLGLPATSVAAFTMVERLLNFLLEVPAGHMADKYGRVPVALVGHGLISLSGLCFFLAFIFPVSALPLVGLAGILIGIGAPLESGSGEAFYQSKLEHIRHEADPRTSQLINESFVLSQNFGKYLILFASLLAFGTLYVLQEFDAVKWIFLLDAIIFLFPAVWLAKDYFRWGDESMRVHGVTSAGQLARRYFTDAKVQKITFSFALIFLASYILGYFLLLGFPASFPVFSKDEIFLMSLIQVVGGRSIGTIIGGFLNPYLARKNFNIYLVGIVLLGLTTAGLYIANEFSSTPLQMGIYLALISSLATVFSMGVSGQSSNDVIANFNHQDYATVLSLKQMPAHLVVAIYSIFLAFSLGGHATILQSSLHLVFILAVACLVLPTKAKTNT